MRTRTLGIVGGILVAAALLLGTFGSAFAQTPGPGFGPGGGWGPGGMMGGFGGGMMGGWWGSSASPSGTPLTIAQAKQAVDGYLASYGDPNLKISEVMEFQENFYAIASEKDTGKGAMELLVNKVTGSVFPEYGPNMMWNTKYSPMARMMGGYWGGAPSGQATVTADQAKSDAQKWLDSNMSGSTTGDIDTFYGYYTFHTEQAGKITGMLSVNGYTGQVWYHTWHGAFILMQSY